MANPYRRLPWGGDDKWRPRMAESSARPPLPGTRRRSIRRSYLLADAHRLIARLGAGWMSSTAYDTAWVARLRQEGDSGQPRFPSTVSWLAARQWPDGSWGGRHYVAHDRVISTLAATVALAAQAAADDKFAGHISRGIDYLLGHRDEVGEELLETVGFELILPPLLAEAKQMGLDLPEEQWEFVKRLQLEKMSRIPMAVLYGGPTTLSHSFEFVGEDFDPALARRCQNPDGSYGSSPSATAFALLHAEDPSADGYLRRVMTVSEDGGVQNVYPIDLFEKGWILFNLGRASLEVPGTQALIADLAGAWSPAGVGFTSHGLLADGDDTAVVFKVLLENGLLVRPRVFKLFEAEDFFFCFSLERNQSVSTNAHILDALQLCPPTTETEEMARKASDYLIAARSDEGYWSDKWHISPYYATAQTLPPVARQLPGEAGRTVVWLLDSQREDGSWGAQEGTDEETGYGLMALAASVETANEREDDVRAAMDQAASFLTGRLDNWDYPELWVGKGLYTPFAVVRSVVLGSLLAYMRVSGKLKVSA